MAGLKESNLEFTNAKKAREGALEAHPCHAPATSQEPPLPRQVIVLTTHFMDEADQLGGHSNQPSPASNNTVIDNTVTPALFSFFLCSLVRLPPSYPLSPPSIRQIASASCTAGGYAAPGPPCTLRASMVLAIASPSPKCRFTFFTSTRFPCTLITS